MRVNQQSLDALCGYDWPGNVRQLENTIERAVALETGEELHVELPAERPKARAAAAGAGLPGTGLPGGDGILPEGVDMEKYVADIEKSLLLAALAQSNGVQTQAGRCAADLLPFVPASDEEVRTVNPSLVVGPWPLAEIWARTSRFPGRRAKGKKAND